MRKICVNILTSRPFFIVMLILVGMFGVGSLSVSGYRICAQSWPEQCPSYEDFRRGRQWVRVAQAGELVAADQSLTSLIQELHRELGPIATIVPSYQAIADRLVQRKNWVLSRAAMGAINDQANAAGIVISSSSAGSARKHLMKKEYAEFAGIVDTTNAADTGPVCVAIPQDPTQSDRLRLAQLAGGVELATFSSDNRGPLHVAQFITRHELFHCIDAFYGFFRAGIKEATSLSPRHTSSETFADVGGVLWAYRDGLEVSFAASVAAARIVMPVQNAKDLGDPLERRLRAWHFGDSSEPPGFVHHYTTPGLDVAIHLISDSKRGGVVRKMSLGEITSLAYLITTRYGADSGRALDGYKSASDADAPLLKLMQEGNTKGRRESERLRELGAAEPFLQRVLAAIEAPSAEHTFGAGIADQELDALIADAITFARDQLDSRRVATSQSNLKQP